MQYARVALLLGSLVTVACNRDSRPTRTAANAARAPARLSPEAARQFLSRYIGFLERPEATVAELYDDQANILTLRHFPDGHTDRQTLRGADYKRAIRTAYARIKMVADPDARASFTDVRVTDDPRGMRISARRYAKIKCTVDPDFYIVVAPDARGVVRIVEESSEIWASSECGIGAHKSLEQRMDEMIAQLAPVLPHMVDGDTRLDQMSREGDVLRYAYTLVRVPAGEFDEPELRAIMLDVLRREACKKPNLRAVLEAKGRLRYSYHDRQGGQIANIELDLEACSVSPKGVVEPSEGPVG
jgi:hypothetical protein